MSFLTMVTKKRCPTMQIGPNQVPQTCCAGVIGWLVVRNEGGNQNLLAVRTSADAV